MEKTTKKPKHRVILSILLVIVILVTVFGAYRGYLAFSTPDEFMITTANYFDYQNAYECSGYASAYALRSLGEEVNGLELYNEFTNKNPDGTLSPIYLKKNLKDMGYKCSFHIGSITDLKYTVSKGTPVIALIRVYTSQQYLHYVPVVGYDEEYIYVADSLNYMVNSGKKHYNRKIAINEFEELWKNDINPVDNIYLTIGVE